MHNKLLQKAWIELKMSDAARFYLSNRADELCGVRQREDEKKNSKTHCNSRIVQRIAMKKGKKIQRHNWYKQRRTKIENKLNTTKTEQKAQKSVLYRTNMSMKNKQTFENGKIHASPKFQPKRSQMTHETKQNKNTHTEKDRERERMSENHYQ